MTFWDALTPYFDQFGLVAPNATRQSTNGVMYTGEAAVIAARCNALDEDAKSRWRALMRTVETPGGFIERTPVDSEKEAPDDHYGYLAGAKLCDPKRALAWLRYGISHAGCYNTGGKLSISDFMWRQPQMITHALWAAGLPVGPFRVFFILSLIFAVWQNKPAGDTDARRLGWLLIQNWDGRGWVSKWAVKRWRSWLFKTYPEGMQDVARLYYGADHPFSIYIPTF